MLIKKIELSNFMCYHGENNVFEFTDGINVIIGDNGYGKSKLYDAFHWVLYDKVFDATKKEFVPTNMVKGDLVSDKAKHINEGKIECSVKITFIDKNKDLYSLERKYYLNKHNGKLLEANNSIIDFAKKDNLLLDFRLIRDEEEKERVLDKILPKNIKPYMWFQGEQVESIIDFGESTSLTRAIDILSNISEFDKIKDIACHLAKSAESEYNQERKKYLKDKDKADDLERGKEKFENLLNLIIEDEKKYSQDYIRLKQETENILLKLEDSNEINKLEEKKNLIGKEIQSLSNDLRLKRITFKKKLFTKNWILKGTEKLHNDFSNKYSNYQKYRMEISAEAKAKEKLNDEILNKIQTRLPINVPEPIYVQQMLEKEICLVCNREAKEGSEPWLKIKELLDIRSEKRKEETKPLFLNDFSLELGRMYQNGLGLSTRIKNIDQDINDEIREIDKLDVKVKSLQEDEKETIIKLEDLLDKVGFKAGDAKNIVNEYRIKQRKYEDVKSNLNLAKQRRQDCELKIKSINSELDGLIVGNIDSEKSDKRNILLDFEKISIEIRECVFEELIIKLENEANKHYAVLTSGNKSAKGIIRLKQQANGNYMPELNDENDNPISGFNTGNMIAIKLAVIMAIISAKSRSENIDTYTLITDAPTSVFGEDYTIGFCKTVSQVYKQSIVMSKEFYRNMKLREELLTNPEINLGQVYILEPSITEKERVNRNNLETIIKKLN